MISPKDPTRMTEAGERRLKVHLQHEAEHRMHNWAICGNASVIFGGPLTFDRNAVTCRACLRLLGEPSHAD